MDLPDDLALPLESGEPWWYWLGGRPAMDFVNTLRERWWRRVETLVTPEDLARWLQRAGACDDAPPVSRGLLAEARELREAIDAAVGAVIDRRPVPGAAIATLDAWLPEAVMPVRLVAGPDGKPRLQAAGAADPGRAALARIAYDAAEMLGTAQRDRVRVCASDTCSARFYDRSRAGRRRWCSMQGCGNVAKARRHRARQAAAAE